MRPSLLPLLLLVFAWGGLLSAEEAEPGRLIWNTGEALAGTLKGANPKDLVWESKWFAEPLVIDASVLQDVSYRRAPAAPQDNFRVLLRDGQCLYGDLVGVDADHVRLKSIRHGEMELRRSEVAEIQRIKSGSLLYAGPNGWAGWKVLDGAKDLDQWARARWAALPMPLWGEMVYLPLEMPDRVEVEFQVSSSERFNFEAALSTGGASKDVPRVEVWDDQLVVVQKDDFVALQPLENSARVFGLRLFVDKGENRILVTNLAGKTLTEWKPPTPIEKLPGFWLHNRAKDLTIESLRIREWDGQAPKIIKTNEPRIETLGGATYYGPANAAPDGTGLATLDEAGTPLTVPWNSISQIVLEPREIKPPVEAQSSTNTGKEKLTGPADPAVTWYSDGEMIQGAITEVKDGRIWQKTAFSETPVASDLSALQLMRLHSPLNDGLGKVTLASMDLLALDKMSLHGTLSGGDGGAIEWNVNGGRRPVRVNAAGAVNITRAMPAKQDWPAAPALFYLSSGEVLPARWLDMDGRTVSFESDVSKVTSLNCSHVKAVHFASGELKTSGFSDPGWHILRGGEKLVTRSADEVKLMPGSAFGHGSMLVGDELAFTLTGDEGFTTLRVRLFCPADGSDAGAVNFMIAHFGSNIYYGLEDDSGNNGLGVGRQQLAIPPGSAAKIKFVMTDKQVEIRINDVSLHRFPIPLSKRQGCGVVFEPSSVWGNAEQPVRLTHFSVHVAPGQTYLPPVRGDAKDQALTVPRSQRDDPPRNVLIASTGDLLRGQIEAATKSHFAFRSGMENIQVPKDRVAAAIWLANPEAHKPKTSAAPAEGKADPADIQPTHWLSLVNGGLIGIKMEKLEVGQFLGVSPLLGECHIPLNLVRKISTVTPEREPTAHYFDDWSLRFAPEPVLPTSAGQNSPMLGKTPQNFALPLLGGGSFVLADQMGKVVVLDFWASWCGPCVKSLPGLIKTLADMPADKVTFVGVNQGEAATDVTQFLESRGWKLKTALDLTQKVAGQFGVEGIPHTVIIGKDGKVAWTRTGYVEGGEKEVAETIQKLLK